MILDIQRMKQATNGMINKRLRDAHEKLLNDPEYEYLKIQSTLVKYQDSDIFNGHYIEALAYISEEFSTDYIYTMAQINSNFSDDSIATENLFLNVAKLNKNTTLLDKIFIIDILNKICRDQRTGSACGQIDINRQYIRIHTKSSGRLFDVVHNPLRICLDDIGECVAKDGFILAVCITSDQQIAVIFSDDEDSTHPHVSFLRDVILLMDQDNKQAHIFGIDIWNKYRNTGKLITINGKWR